MYPCNGTVLGFTTIIATIGQEYSWNWRYLIAMSCIVPLHTCHAILQTPFFCHTATYIKGCRTEGMSVKIGLVIISTLPARIQFNPAGNLISHPCHSSRQKVALFAAALAHRKHTAVKVKLGNVLWLNYIQCHTDWSCLITCWLS